jgi:hypothetical protein
MFEAVYHIIWLLSELKVCVMLNYCLYSTKCYLGSEGPEYPD